MPHHEPVWKPVKPDIDVAKEANQSSQKQLLGKNKPTKAVKSKTSNQCKPVKPMQTNETKNMFLYSSLGRLVLTFS